MRDRAIFAEQTPIIEPLSLDEAYLDVTENLQCIPLARDVAFTIRAKIKEVSPANEWHQIYRHGMIAGRSELESQKKGVSALRNELPEIIIRPVNGWLNSRIRKSEAEADSAKMQSAVIVVALMSANRLKLMKMIVSQKTSTTRNGVGIDPPAFANSNNRAFPTSVTASIARFWSRR